MVDCCIVLCGTRVRRKRQKKISPELQRVLDTKPICFCQNCNATREPIIYRYNNKGPEVLCCPVCTGQLQIGNESNICAGCGRWNSQRGGFCPACGMPVQAPRVNVHK